MERYSYGAMYDTSTCTMLRTVLCYYFNNQLSWTCPRTGQKAKGCFYWKSTPTQNNLVYGQDDIVKLGQKLGPMENEEFEYKGLDHGDIFKEMLLRHLSLLCNFTAIDIPDGGSCCDWIAGAVLLNEIGRAHV